MTTAKATKNYRDEEMAAVVRKSTKAISVQPDWMWSLPLQQQSVLLLGARGPDTIGKFHSCKDVVRAYRGTVFKAAYFGRLLRLGEKADTFMTLDIFANDMSWNVARRGFFDSVDDLPHHYLMHLIHGVEILGYKHPDDFIQTRWRAFYLECVYNFHMNPETMEQMDNRLGDWGRVHWEE